GLTAAWDRSARSLPARDPMTGAGLARALLERASRAAPPMDEAWAGALDWKSSTQHAEHGDMENVRRPRRWAPRSRRLRQSMPGTFSQASSVADIGQRRCEACKAGQRRGSVRRKKAGRSFASALAGPLRMAEQEASHQQGGATGLPTATSPP